MAAENYDFTELKNKLQVLNEFPLDKYIPLVPVTLLEASGLTKLAVNMVKFSDNPADGDVYLRESKLVPTRKGLGRLMAAANIQQMPSENMLPTVCQKCAEVSARARMAPKCGECPSKEDVARQVSIKVPCMDGTYRTISFTKEIRMEEEKGRLKPNQFNEMRSFRTEHAESKALNRCIRFALGLKSGYTPAEIKEKSFIIVYPVANLDDEDIKRAMIARLAFGSDALFGGRGVPMLETPREPVMVIPDDGLDERPDDQPIEQETHHDVPDDELFADVCHKCGEQIKDTQTSYGLKSKEDIIKYSTDKYGEALCMACQKIAYKERRGEQ